MKGRWAIAVAIIAGIVAIASPIAMSLYWAGKQARDEHMATAAAVAAEALGRIDATSDQIWEAFRRLAAAESADPCSEENIRLMRRLTFELEQLTAVGYVSGDRMVCSSFGRHDSASAGIPMGPVTHRTRSGALVRTAVQIELTPGMTFLASTHEATGYTVLVHRDASMQIFPGRQDLSIGAFSTDGRRLLVSRGHFDPAWMEALGGATAAELVDDRHLVAIRVSPRYQVAAYAAMEKSSLEAALRQAMILMVPMGLAAGLVLGLAVLFTTRRLMSMPALIRSALRRREFFLVYQPIVELESGRCVGAEALVRWRRADGTMVRPDHFIPVAEESGLIHEITKQVIEKVARDTALLLRTHPGLHIGINFSSRDLEMPQIVRLLRDMIHTMGIKPQSILVEATERGFMRVDVARRILDEIRALNVKIAIDDFGTGYSSLSYLENLPLDYLKIDKSFVGTMGGDAATSQVAPHIIEMARSLRLEMIAEGVETEAQATFLRQRGVRYAQGYFFAKPMPFPEFASYFAASAQAVPA